MKQTLFFNRGVYVAAGATIVGDKEGNGPFGKRFDKVLEDDKWGEATFEAAERKMLSYAIGEGFEKALQTPYIEKSKSPSADGRAHGDVIIGGDLLNQIISASFASRDLGLPFLGVYGACSTICEALLVGACLTDGGFVSNALCCACSHFSTAERQYRLPLEYGSQPIPSSQRTVTGAGCTVLTGIESPVRVNAATIGRVVDLGIKDSANMGAAMAPAAADTLSAFFGETGTDARTYDLILTGDLGKLGKELLITLMAERGYEMGTGYNDCGCMIYGGDEASLMGGSGAGCAASVLNGVILPDLFSGKLNSVLLAATGALLSPTSTLQGESIPGISYCVSFGRNK